LFDNHNDQQPQVSRALEYAVDETARTATLVWEWQTDPPLYAIAMANTQRLANGNTFIGWGTNSLPSTTEVTPDGKVAFELAFGGSNVTYRAFRLPWQGYPTWPPALVARTTNNILTLAFSWNGATEAAGYWIYGGNASPPDILLAAQPKTGFETSVALADSANAYCFYQVIPFDAHGTLGQPSAVVHPPAADRSTCGAG
jgi:hypothetical protein